MTPPPDFYNEDVEVPEEVAKEAPKNSGLLTYEEIVSQSTKFKPVAFGITKNDMGVNIPTDTLQCNFLTCSYKENYDVASVLRYVLEQNLYSVPGTLLVKKSKTEVVFDLTEKVIQDLITIISESKTVANAAKGSELGRFANILAILAGMIHDIQMSKENLEWGKGVLTFRAVILMSLSDPVETVEGGYLKLYLVAKKIVSNKIVSNKDINFNGLDDLLKVCAWCNGVPVEYEFIRSKGMELKAYGNLNSIDYIGKYPKLINFVFNAEIASPDVTLDTVMS